MKPYSDESHTMMNRRTEENTYPHTDPEVFAQHDNVYSGDSQVLDRVIDQHVIENGVVPLCLSDFPSVIDILRRYPNLSHYRGIPFFMSTNITNSVQQAIDAGMDELIQDDVPPILEAIDGLNRIAEGIEFDYEDKSPGFEARLKNIEGKPPMSLINSSFLEGIARVLAVGSVKYGPNMWREDPMPHTAEIDSILRHLVAFGNGEDIDPGTGELHLFAIGCRLSFLCERYYTRPDLDDRYKPFGQIGPTDLNRYAHLQGGCVESHECGGCNE